jgi:phosphate starvation-inducible PhoH-like protein
MTRTRKKKFTERKPVRPPLLPKTERQADYIKAIVDSQQVVVLGPAGTGKTYIAATIAADMYADGLIDKIILTRPNVSAGKSIGFFPGSLEDKMAPWMAPVIDVLSKRLDQGVYETAFKSGNIEIVPFETMRGRSFNDSFVILDEAQNTSPHEMKMFLTRIGENCKVIINGDIMQSDLHDSSGLSKAIHMTKKYMLPVPVIEFQVNDIVRSDLCKQWIIAWMKEEKTRG